VPQSPKTTRFEKLNYRAASPALRKRWCFRYRQKLTVRI